MARSGCRWRRLWPHLIIVFIFCSYLLLGACGLYFLVFPSPPPSSTTGSTSAESRSSIEKDTFDDSEFLPRPFVTHDGGGGDSDDQGFIEMNIDIPCSEAKRRLKELDRLEAIESHKDRTEELRKFTFTRAVLVCFNWITTIGNRWPADWAHSESPPPEVNSGGQYHHHHHHQSQRATAAGHRSDGDHLDRVSLISKFFAISYTILGIPLAFVTVANFAALLYDCVNSMCFAVRRRWHSRVITADNKHPTQIRRDLAESRLWNPLWFSLLLSIYLMTGAVIVRRVWTVVGRPISFAEALWNCTSLVLAIGETTRDIFVLPQTAANCFVQIVYSLIGLIIFGAFLRSFLPLAAFIYEPRQYERKKLVVKEEKKKPKPKKDPIAAPLLPRSVEPPPKKSEKPQRKPLVVRQEEGGILRRALSKESPLFSSKLSFRKAPPPSGSPQPSSTYTPRSILRQRNGAITFEPKSRDSLDSLSTEDLTFPPMVVRFAMPTPPEEHLLPIRGDPHSSPRRKPSLDEFHRTAPSWVRESSPSASTRPWSSERSLVQKPVPMPRKLKPKSATSVVDSQTSLMFSVNPDSIPFADDRPPSIVM